MTLTGLALAGTLAVGVAQEQPPPQPRQQPPLQAPSGQPQEAVQQIQQLQQQAQQIEERLAEVQEKAAENRKVKSRLESFEKAVYEQMTQSAPDMKSEVNRLQKLTNELRESEQLRKPAEERTESFNEKLVEYGALKRQLGPIEQEAARNPEVAKLGQEYHQTMLAAMQEINPRTEELIGQHQKVVQAIQTLQTRLPQPPPPGSPQAPPASP